MAESTGTGRTRRPQNRARTSALVGGVTSLLLAAGLIFIVPTGPSDGSTEQLPLGLISVRDGEASATDTHRFWLAGSNSDFDFLMGWRMDTNPEGLRATFRLEVRELFPGPEVGALIGEDEATPTSGDSIHAEQGVLRVRVPADPSSPAVATTMTAILEDTARSGTRVFETVSVVHIGPDIVKMRIDGRGGPFSGPPWPSTSVNTCPPQVNCESETPSPTVPTCPVWLNCEPSSTPKPGDVIAVALPCNLDVFSAIETRPDYMPASDLCRALNSALGECDKNGYCECGSQVGKYLPSEVDFDKDGVPDSEDPDDDCDHLSDDLEAHFGLNAYAASSDGDLIPDSRDMLPGQDQPIFITVMIKTITQIKQLDSNLGCGSSCWGDPYLGLGTGITIHSADSPAERPLSFAKLSASDHINNQEVIHFNTALGNDHGSTATAGNLSQDFNNPDYAWRDGATDFPKFRIVVPLKDDDPEDGGENREGPEDEEYGQIDGLFILSLLQVANKAVGRGEDPLPQDVAWRLGGETQAGANIFIKTNLLKCAVYWASYTAGQQASYVVDLARLPNQGANQQC